MNYDTYWSILDTPSHTIKSNIVCFAITLIFGLLWFLIRKFKKDSGEGDRLIMLWGAGIFTILGFLWFMALTFVYEDRSNEQTLKILNATTTPKVEGVVSNFQRTFRNTRAGSVIIERFTVDSLKFAYGDELLGKFNSFSETNNRIIFNGQFVRITYGKGSAYGDNYNTILKLEIGK